MRSWSVLSTVVLAGALAASPAYAHGPSAAASTPYDTMPLPYGDALTMSDVPQVNACCTAEQSAMDTESGTIDGIVAALDRDSGHFLVDTDEGLVSLVTWPDELIPIDIGDTVHVSLLPSEG